MTNIEKWPEAFENGIPKVGGRWAAGGKMCEVTKPNASGGSDEMKCEDGRKFPWTRGDFACSIVTFLGFSDPPAQGNQGAAAPQKPPEGWLAVEALAAPKETVK